MPCGTDDGIGARQIAGLCGGVSAALIAKASPKGLRAWLMLAGPYTFTPLAEDRLLPLNRYYKPVGLGKSHWVTYTTLRPWRFLGGGCAWRSPIRSIPSGPTGIAGSICITMAMPRGGIGPVCWPT